MSKQQSTPVTALLLAAGAGPWFSFPSFAAALRLAETIAETIADPIGRAAFVAQAAGDLNGCVPSELDEVEAERLAYFATGIWPTPLGAVEIWGSLWD